jgi:signal transduction histidine kinase
VKLPVRFRLTLFFSVLFGVLLILSMGLLYRQVSRNLQKDFTHEMVHDGRIIAELFKEEVKLNALKEFQEEIQEFEIELQVRDENKKVVIQSDGWNSTGVILGDEIFESLKEKPSFNEIKINEKDLLVFNRPVHIPSHGNYSLHIVRSKNSLNKITNQLLQWVLIITPFMLLLSTVAGYVFSSRTLEAEERTLEQLKRFTADASHELRIPLTALRGNLEIALKKDRSPNEYKETIAEALHETEQLTRLTKDLLLLAQSDSDQIKINKVSVNAKEFIEDVFSNAQMLAHDKNIKIHLDSMADGFLILDPDRIRQLLLNLIDNAIKYNKPGGEIRINSQRTNSQFILAVQDTGIGIEPQDIENIFERFYRVDKARSREEGGSGLGLSIVKWIIDAHGGTIKVESEKNKGSTFVVKLPLS